MKSKRGFDLKIKIRIIIKEIVNPNLKKKIKKPHNIKFTLAT